MQEPSVKLPKKSAIAGLYLYCNKCKRYYKDDGKVKCKCERLVYRTKIHVPKTQKDVVIKTLESKNLNDALIEFSDFKKKLILTNYDLSNQIVKSEMPVSLIDCMTVYMGYLNNEGIPTVLRKERSIGHIKDYERNFKYYIEALKSGGVSVETLRFSDINIHHVEYVHQFIEKEKGASNRYYNNIINALRIFTKYIIDEYSLNYRNPFNTVPKKYVAYAPKTVSYTQFQKLLNVIVPENGIKVLSTGERKNLYRDWLKDAIQLALFTGGRRDEFMRLRWSDIVLDELGKPILFRSTDYKFNRAHSHITNTKDRKVKEFVIYPEFLHFLYTIGCEKYISTNKYVVAPETHYKRETMIDLISKAFAHFLSKTDIKEHLMFKQLRKTFNTSVRMQYGDHAHFITGHEGMAVLDKYYVNKSSTQETMRRDFTIYEKKKEIPDSNS